MKEQNKVIDTRPTINITEALDISSDVMGYTLFYQRFHLTRYINLFSSFVIPMDQPNSKPNLIPALIVLLLHLMQLVIESSPTADFSVSMLVVTGLLLSGSFKCDSAEPAV